MRISDWSSDVCSSDLQDSAEAQTLRLLRQLERKVLWLSSWMIHNANHVRESRDGLKVGGHQASSASLATLMTALSFHVLRPQDRVARSEERRGGKEGGRTCSTGGSPSTRKKKK